MEVTSTHPFPRLCKGDSVSRDIKEHFLDSYLDTDYLHAALRLVQFEIMVPASILGLHPTKALAPMLTISIKARNVHVLCDY